MSLAIGFRGGVAVTLTADGPRVVDRRFLGLRVVGALASR